MNTTERSQRIEELRQRAAQPGADLPAIREEIAKLLDDTPKPKRHWCAECGGSHDGEDCDGPTDTTAFAELANAKARIAELEQQLRLFTSEKIRVIEAQRDRAYEAIDDANNMLAMLVPRLDAARDRIAELEQQLASVKGLAGEERLKQIKKREAENPTKSTI